MKNSCYLFLFFSTIFQVYSQSVSDSINQKIEYSHFSQFIPEPEPIKVYNYLELRYIDVSKKTFLSDSIFIDGKKQRLFKTRTQAIEYYYIIKHLANSREIYYVVSLTFKYPDVFPFEVKD